jgi:hypothetical protein
VNELLEQWRDPVFNDPHHNVPAALAARLTEMADEITAGENIAEAIANATIPDAPDDLLVTPLRHAALPRSLRIYYDRMYTLLTVAGSARITDPATFQLDSPPSDTEQRFGAVLGQAFHQGCQLADVALAAGLPPDQVVAIGKRTIRRTGWLKHI